MMRNVPPQAIIDAMTKFEQCKQNVQPDRSHMLAQTMTQQCNLIFTEETNADWLMAVSEFMAGALIQHADKEGQDRQTMICFMQYALQNHLAAYQAMEQEKQDDRPTH